MFLVRMPAPAANAKEERGKKKEARRKRQGERGKKKEARRKRQEERG